MKKPKLRLVLVQARHVSPTWLRWLKDPVTRKWIFAAKKTRTLRDLRRTVDEWTANPNVYPYAIEAQWKPGVWVHIGNVKADIGVNPALERYATIGILMAPEVRGLGYGVVAIKKVVRRLRYNFPKIAYINAGIHGRNWASLKAFEKAGFYIEYPPQLWAVRRFK